MSAIGTKRTSLVALHMSAFGGKAAALSCRTAADYRDLDVVSSLSTLWPGTEVFVTVYRTRSAKSVCVTMPDISPFVIGGCLSIRACQLEIPGFGLSLEI
jgi:hypothetical protein